MKKFLWGIILAAIILKLFFFISANKNYFLRPFNAEYFSKLYSESQYVKGELSKGGIGDDGLYAFAGYYYLFQKGDVSSVNFEHPPLGKYLIGLSIFLFKNENVINIAYFIILLFLTYRMSQMMIKDNLLAIMAVLILSFDPLLNDHLIRSLLDLPFMVFFVSAVYFFLLGLNKSSYLYLSFIFWGFTFSTKFFPFMIVIYLYLMFIIFFYKKRYRKTFIIASFFVPVIYLICHFSFFIYHPSIIEFIRHKKWMLSWFTGSPRIFGNLLRNIFTASYLDSTLVLRKNEYWTILLPLVTVFSIFRFRFNLIDKKNLNIFFLYGIFLSYFTYVLIFTIGIIKYLMPVYALMVILALNNISDVYSIISSCRKPSLPKSKAKS